MFNLTHPTSPPSKSTLPASDPARGFCSLSRRNDSNAAITAEMFPPQDSGKGRYAEQLSQENGKVHFHLNGEDKIWWLDC